MKYLYLLCRRKFNDMNNNKLLLMSLINIFKLLLIMTENISAEKINVIPFIPLSCWNLPTRSSKNYHCIRLYTYHKTIRIVHACSLVNRCVSIGVCKHGCDII